MAPEDQLCLLLARGRLTPEAEQQARQILAATLDWRQILDRVRTHEILPLFCRNLKRLGFPGVPPPMEAELARLFQVNALRNALLAGEVARVLSLFADAHVPVISLKGTPLAESLFEDASLRVCADIDLLVPPRHFPEACGLLRSSGYEAEFTQPALLEVMARHGKDCAFTRRDQACWYPLQLHCGLIWGGSAERSVTEEIWSSAVRAVVHGVPGLALSPDWEFLYLAVHAARHGLFPLKWLVDIDAFCSRNTIDWEHLMDKARRLGWERAVQSTLSTCAELLQMPVPARAAGPPASRIGSFGSYRTSAIQIPRETLFSLRLLTSTSQKIRFLAARLFIPTPGDCEWLPLPSPLFFLYYALRPLRVTCLVARWLVQAGWRQVSRA